MKASSGMFEEGFDGMGKKGKKPVPGNDGCCGGEESVNVVGQDLTPGNLGAIAELENLQEVSSTPEGQPCPGLSSVFVEQYESTLRDQTQPGMESSPAGIARGEREFGDSPSFIERVIGSDDRVPISDTTAVPYKRICYLSMTTSLGFKFKGTGWLIGPRVLITAGHCVYNRDRGYGAGYMSSVRVFAGRNGQFDLGTANATRVETTQRWIDSGDVVWDFGAIFLDRPLGNEMGFFGFANLPDVDLNGKLVNVIGYPGEKPATLWGRVDRIVGVSSQRLEYLSDTTGGQSGCPVIYNDGTGKYTVVGIHNYGGNQSNFATRINATVIQMLRQWKSQGG